MAYKTFFKRYELKYMLTLEQKQSILEAMVGHMKLDNYGRTVIRNVYFDTDTYLLIRRSIEKPLYKEKLRIRSYGKATAESDVFVEIKKKFDHVVYKRRVSMTESEATSWLCERSRPPTDSQISREIDYFVEHYKALHPVLFLSYEREAYYSTDGSDFRVTFDDRMLCRQHDISLNSEAYGKPLLDNEHVLMELKCSGGIPLWMVRKLSDERIYKTSFSKYGTAYQSYIYPFLTATNRNKNTKENDIYVCTSNIQGDI